MRILSDSEIFSDKQIALIENKYDAKYVFESCIKDINGNWANFPVAIFYTEEKYPEGSNYFGLYINEDRETIICDGISATEPFIGIAIDENVIYSRYRHDYREFFDIFIDGGRDYLRYGGDTNENTKIVNIKVVKSNLEIENAIIS
jgi:hypothetical protein